MPKVTNDDLEHKLDDIKIVLGIQTTTSSVLDSIKRDLDDIKDNLTEADRKFRKSLWLTCLVAPGVALIATGIIGFASVVAEISLASAKVACFSIFLIGTAMVIGPATFVCFKIRP